MRWPWSRRSTTPDVDVAKASPTSSVSGFTSAAATPAAPSKPAGSDGIVNVGGFLVTGERDPGLVGINKWTAFDNAILGVAIVSSAVNIWTQLVGSAKLTVEPNKIGGQDAQRAADIVDQGFLNAQLTTPVNQIFRRQSMKRFKGFAVHEVLLKRRAADDMIVVGDIQDRPQWTIWRWNRPDPQAEWTGVEQMTPAAGQNTWYIPRERLFYSVENTLSPSPEGVGVLRQLADHVRRLALFKKFEGIGFQTDLSGVPVARAPLAKLQNEMPQGLSPAEIKAKVLQEVGWMYDLLKNHNKNAEQGILLDSATYTDKSASQSPSSIYEYAFDLIKGSGSTSLAAIGEAIGRETADIARVMCAEWLLLGGQDSGGAYSMHEDKTAMFALCVNSVNEDLAADAKRDIAARLLVMNGIDPELFLPNIIVEPVATGSVQAACQALASLFQAGLNPTDPAINVLRGRLKLPPAPEIDDTDLLLPRGTEIERVGPDGRLEALDPAAAPATAASDPGQAAPGEPVGKYAPDQPRAADGKWTSGGGSGAAAGHSWTRAFDSRDHMRQIEGHRADEQHHRDAAADLKGKIKDLKSKARAASPGRAAQIESRVSRLQAQHDAHIGAAHDSAAARRAAQADLAGRRAAHAQGLRDQSDARRDAAAAHAQNERDAIGRVGGMRIGGEGDHEAHDGSEGTGSSPVPHYAETPEHYMGIGTGGRIAGEPEVIAPPSTSPTREMTSEQWAERGRQQYAEWQAAQDHQRLQRETAARQAARAADEEQTREHGAADLPRASAGRPSLGDRLRGLLSRKQASASGAITAQELEALLAEHEEPTT
ncbi:MAG TPA: hypothetical protein VFQ42_22410 [Mycobacterium sp.]|nr:hypothetical protein [Mycobacterium sp.]